MTWFLAFIIMLLVVLGMAIGVIMGRKPIAGSCGGIAKLGIEKDECPVCGGDQDKCDEANAEGLPDLKKRKDLAYDASKH